MTRYLLAIEQPDVPPPPDVDMEGVMRRVEALVEEAKALVGDPPPARGAGCGDFLPFPVSNRAHHRTSPMRRERGHRSTIGGAEADMTVVDWLRDSDPSIRWQVMRDVSGAA
jgi:hypothetical protein